jgi:hypothetical protein
MWLEIVLVAFAASMTFAFGRLAKRLDKRDQEAALRDQKAEQHRIEEAQKAEEWRREEERKAEIRQQEIITGRMCELDYMDSVGTMAHRTAQAVINKELANGEVTRAIEYYVNCKHALENYLRAANVKNAVK